MTKKQWIKFWMYLLNPGKKIKRREEQMIKKDIYKSISVYRDDFKIDSEGNSYFDYVLEQAGIPEDQQADIEEIDLTVIEYETH